MGETTAISWCDATFNSWWGCSKVSPACAHCYAERDSERYGFKLWGADHDFRWLSEANWRKPLLWAAKPEKILPPGEDRRPRVFTASMADVFEERPEVEEPRRRLFDLIVDTPELDWLVLTKRPDFARDWLRDWNLVGEGPLPPNLWLGVSIENAAYTWRADVLREIPAAVRFLSCEPLLGSLFPDRTRDALRAVPSSSEGDPGTARHGAQSGPEAPRAEGPLDPNDARGHGARGDLETADVRPHETPALRRGAALRRAPLNLDGIDWVIVGGESGARADARPMHPAWAREIRDAVQQVEHDTGTRPALHMKQWGSWTPDPFGRDRDGIYLLPDGSRIPARRLRNTATLPDGAVRMRYAGPRAGDGGKFLDGTDHCEFPEARILMPA